MGVRSDVVVALKMGAFNRLPKSTQEWLKRDCNNVHWACDLKDGVDLKDDGVAFRWDAVKWYASEYSEIVTLYKDLQGEDCEDYLVISACSEYPTSDEDDRGAWYENPWEFYKCTTCTVEGVV
jgi:hypothetical protein